MTCQIPQGHLGMKRSERGKLRGNEDRKKGLVRYYSSLSTHKFERIFAEVENQETNREYGARSKNLQKLKHHSVGSVQAK